MTEKRPLAIFAVLFNTLLGSGIILLPSELCRSAGSNAFLVPAVLTPLFLGCALVFSRLSECPAKGILPSVIRTAYILLTTAGAAVCIWLTAEISSALFLPDCPRWMVCTVLAATCWFIIKCGEDAFMRLNILTMGCFAVIIMLFSISVFDMKDGNVTMENMNWEPSSYGSAAVAFSGIVICSTLKKRSAGTAPMLIAVVSAVAVYVFAIFVIIGCIGAKTASMYPLSVLLTMKSGTSFVYTRLFFSALIFNLLLLKPAVNMTFAAADSLKILTGGNRICEAVIPAVAGAAAVLLSFFL